jgi:hypothetical protein
MLSFLKLRAIVNGRDIYPLANTKPVVITVEQNHPRVVITDGYHYTQPLKLVYNELPLYCFKVVCAVNDMQLLGGSIFLSFFYLAGLFSGMLILKVCSFLPLLYLLMFYYLNRKDFIKLIPVLN